MCTNAICHSSFPFCRIVIEPNLETSTNNGSLVIEIERDPKVTTWEPIVLDVFNVSIDNVRVLRAPRDKYAAEEDLKFECNYGEDNSTFVVTLNEAYANESQLRVELSLQFVSQITDTLQGIYKTSYTSPEATKPR